MLWELSAPVFNFWLPWLGRLGSRRIVAVALPCVCLAGRDGGRKIPQQVSSNEESIATSETKRSMQLQVPSPSSSPARKLM